MWRVVCVGSWLASGLRDVVLVLAASMVDSLAGPADQAEGVGICTPPYRAIGLDVEGIEMYQTAEGEVRNFPGKTIGGSSPSGH